MGGWVDGRTGHKHILHIRAINDKTQLLRNKLNFRNSGNSIVSYRKRTYVAQHVMDHVFWKYNDWQRRETNSSDRKALPTGWEMLDLHHFGLKPLANCQHTVCGQTEAAASIKQSVFKVCWSGKKQQNDFRCVTVTVVQNLKFPYLILQSALSSLYSWKNVRKKKVQG